MIDIHCYLIPKADDSPYVILVRAIGSKKLYIGT